MKNIFLTTILLFIACIVASAQNFYVEKTTEGYEQPVIDKLIELKQNVTVKKESSDYTVQCLIVNKGGWGVPAEGCVMILDTKTGNVILKSNSAKAMVNMFRGFQNPRFLIMKKIAKEYLSELLLQLKK